LPAAKADGEPRRMTINGKKQDWKTPPTQVRFGWHDLAGPNLINNEGLPASPFQTNNWQDGTAE
jgi:hypothetical protein